MEEVGAALGMESVGIYFSVGEESQEDMQCPLNRCQPLSKMGSLQSVLRHHPPSSHVTLLERMRVGREEMTDSMGQPRRF